jgi:hypothetical protein
LLRPTPPQRAGYAFGPHARFSGFQKSSSLCCPDSHEKSLNFYQLKDHEKRARVHFIPSLKVGVFVTLSAPKVIIRKNGCLGTISTDQMTLTSAEPLNQAAL